MVRRSNPRRRWPVRSAAVDGRLGGYRDADVAALAQLDLPGRADVDGTDSGRRDVGHVPRSALGPQASEGALMYLHFTPGIGWLAYRLWSFLRYHDLLALGLLVFSLAIVVTRWRRA